MSEAHAWDKSWLSAYQSFDELAGRSAAMASMRDLVKTLKDNADVRGLFAITSITTLRVSPYSIYPDWFDGRHIQVDPINSNSVVVRFMRAGHDHSPKRFDVSFDNAATTISQLCADHL